VAVQTPDVNALAATVAVLSIQPEPNPAKLAASLFCVGGSSTTRIAAGSAFFPLSRWSAAVFPLAPNPRPATPRLCLMPSHPT